jgi:hypothetical protein
MATEKNDRENEIILDKIRKLSMCGDQDRISNSNLLDAMATIAEQIALVARMGDEDENATTGDLDNDMIDDRSGLSFLLHDHLTPSVSTLIPLLLSKLIRIISMAGKPFHLIKLLMSAPSPPIPPRNITCYRMTTKPNHFRLEQSSIS